MTRRRDSEWAPSAAAHLFQRRRSKRPASPSATARPWRCETRSEVMPGESHALVGRNGAGKSTLVGILTGLRRPTAARCGSPASPRRRSRPRGLARARRLRLPALHHHPRPDRRREPLRQPPAAAGRLHQLVGPAPGGAQGARPLERRRQQRGGDLTVEARQLVEIARALSYGARFIILDEPTAQLDGEEIKRLFRHIRELQAQGVTFLFISHHLQEVYEICQAVTVLRDARHILRAGRRPAEGPADRGDDGRVAELPAI